MQIVSKCIADFIRGQTSKQILMRLILKEDSPKFDLGPISSPEEVAKAYDRLVRAVSKRKITPQDGLNVGYLLEGKRKALETLSQEPRLQALEAAQRNSSKQNSGLHKVPLKDAA